MLEPTTLDVSWAQVRAALPTAAERVAGLVETMPEPTRPALGEWNTLELAQHLSHAWITIAGLACRDLPAVRAGLPTLTERQIGLPSGALLTSMEELAGTCVDLVAADTERDPAALATRIRTAAAELLERMPADTDDQRRPWMIEGIHATPAYFGAHLLNESLTHGHDLAAALGQYWPVDDGHAALVLRGFLLPILTASSAAAAARGEAVAPFGLDLRLAGDRRLSLHAGPGPLTARLGPPPTRPPARMWVRPSALLLLAWGRVGLRTIMINRQIAIWGRRPWTAQRLMDFAPSA